MSDASGPADPIADSTPASGEAIFLAQLELIDRVIGFVCRRNRLNPSDAEDFASHARLRLMDDGYAILRKFQGRSSLKTFLGITLQRLFYDYRTAAWGKWRPSAEARRRGPVAVLLEQLLGRDGHTFEEALEILTVNHRVTETRADLERMAASLPPRLKRRVEQEEALAAIPSNEAADAAANAEERRQAAGRVGRALQELLGPMSAQDRLILRLRFEDGRTVADIAAMLRLEPKGLYRRLERLFRDLRSGLESRGVTAEEVSSLMGEALIDLNAAVVETGGGRPSMPRGADAWP